MNINQAKIYKKMIKCTNFLRKYVTSTPLFHEKTHFFKKKIAKHGKKPQINVILIYWADL